MLSSISQGTKIPGSALRAIFNTTGALAAAVVGAGCAPVAAAGAVVAAGWGAVGAGAPHAAMSNVVPSAWVNRLNHRLLPANMVSPLGI